MPKIRINSLPDGFEFKDNKIVKSLVPMQKGGTTGSQSGYSLVTTPNSTRGNSINRSSDKDARYSLTSVPRQVANIEAEGGETVYTDLNNDGRPGLYNIKGPRHSKGGVPMYLPDNSFIYSDTNSMKMNKSEMSEFGIKSRKKMTPAKVSKKFDINKYMAALESKDADSIRARSAEMMLDKNQKSLSKLAFIQEAKKNFKDGVPDAASTFLMSRGIDPKEFSEKVKQANMQVQRPIPQARYGGSLPKYQNAGSVGSGDPFKDGTIGRDDKGRLLSEKYYLVPTGRGQGGVRIIRGDQYNPDRDGKFISSAYEENLDALQRDMVGYTRGVQNTALEQQRALEEENRRLVNERINNQITRSQGSQGRSSGSGDSLSNIPEYKVVKHLGLDVPDALVPYIRRKKNGKPVLMLTNNLTTYEKHKLSQIANDFGVDKFIQPGNDDSSYGRVFHGGITAVDFEKIYVAGLLRSQDKTLTEKEAFDRVESMSEKEVRRKFWGHLKFKPSREDAYDNPKSVYRNDTNPEFKRFYRTFTDSFPDDEFRKALGDDSKIGVEHPEYRYNSFVVTPTPTPEPEPEEKPTPEPEEKPAPKPEIKPTPIDVTIEPGDVNVPKKTYTSPNPKFWLQDLIKMNALAQRDRDIFMPWQPEPQAFVPQYVLEDPTRALANINEQLGIGTQSLAAFAGPQSFSARASEMQGKAMSASADALAGVNNRNVDRVNQGLAREAVARQQIGLEADRRNVQEYDDSNVALQKYMDELNLDREQQADLLANAYTNRANTYNLNQLYDYFDVDPMSGGIINYNGLAPRFRKDNSLDKSDPTADYLRIFEDVSERISDPKVAAEAAKSIFNQMYPGSSKSNVKVSAKGELSPAQMADIVSQQSGASYPNSMRKGGSVKKYIVPFYTGKVGF